MPIKTPKNIEKYEYYKAKKGLIVVKFGAEWCGPCKKIAPFFKELKSKYQGTFVDVDVDIEEILEHEDCADIATVPTFKIFLDGELKKVITGADKEKLNKYVKKYGVKKETKKEEETPIQN